jgi:hypothetical protein
MLFDAASQLGGALWIRADEFRHSIGRGPRAAGPRINRVVLRPDGHAAGWVTPWGALAQGCRRSCSLRLRSRALSWAFFECAPNARAEGSLDGISKHIMANAEVVPPPRDDTGPSQTAEELSARLSPSSSGHPSSDDPRERAQKSLKRLTTPSADKQVQMRPDIRKFVHADPEATRHFP